MGKKYKFRATASCQARLVDRFSILPKEISHHILSFLNFTDLTRLGTVSKTCRKFCLSSPSVKFKGYYQARNKEKQAEFFNSVKRYFLGRGDNRMQQFCIFWDLFWQIPDENLQILSWIENAVRCNVEVLHLSLGVRDAMMFVLPSCIFLSQSLRSLSVDCKMILKVPSSSFSSNLHYLKLNEVKIADENFFKWISFSCKCIKELQLIRITGMQNITIESSSLEIFKVWSSDLIQLNIFGEKLEDIRIVWRNVSSSRSSKSLNIFTPNLKSLKWEGNVINSQDLGRLMSLEKAVILLEPDVNDCKDVCKVLCSVRRAKVTLNERTMKALLTEGALPAPLDDICKLGLHLRSLNDGLVRAVVSLLEGMPNLNTLHIKWSFSTGVANYLCSGVDMKYWKSQNLAFIHQLKEATLELSNGSNGIELAKYIVEHAENLEKMVIFHLLKQSDDARELKKNIISNATVVSQVRKQQQNIWSDDFDYNSLFM